jgi:hypothetical protein
MIQEPLLAPNLDEDDIAASVSSSDDITHALGAGFFPAGRGHRVEAFMISPERIKLTLRMARLRTLIMLTIGVLLLSFILQFWSILRVAVIAVFLALAFLVPCLVCRFLLEYPNSGTRKSRATALSIGFAAREVMIILTVAAALNYPQRLSDLSAYQTIFDADMVNGMETESFERVKKGFATFFGIVLLGLYCNLCTLASSLDLNVQFPVHLAVCVIAVFIQLGNLALNYRSLTQFFNMNDKGSIAGFVFLTVFMFGPYIMASLGKKRLEQLQEQLFAKTARLEKDKAELESKLELRQELETMRRLNIAAEEKAKAEQQLQAYLFHEIRNPMNAITHCIMFSLQALEGIAEDESRHTATTGSTEKRVAILPQV